MPLFNLVPNSIYFACISGRKIHTLMLLPCRPHITVILVHKPRLRRQAVEVVKRLLQRGGV